jgi:HSP20 family protein
LAILCDDVDMRPRVHALAVSSELGEFADELRQVFQELGRTTSNEGLAGECAPAVDIYETDESVEVIADLPGVDRSAIRILSKGDWLLIAGEKPPRRVRAESSFHLVERDYGRFARGVRVSRACDMSKASASLANGELRVSLPKLPDRRGVVQPILIKDNSH